MPLSRITGQSISNTSISIDDLSSAGNTAIYVPAANTIAFKTSNINRILVANTGNVNIGSSETNSLAFTYDGLNGLATMGPNSTGGSTTLTLGTSNSGTYIERVRVGSTGRVGIGQTDPSANLELGSASSTATFRLRSTSTSFGSVADISCIGTSNQVSDLAFFTRDGDSVLERVRITGDGGLFVRGRTNNGFIASQKLISVSNGSTISFNAGFGAHIYVSLGDGSSAVYWSPWASGTTLLNSAGQSFTATDSGTATRVYKSGSTADVTLRNSTGGTNNYYILIISGY